MGFVDRFLPPPGAPGAIRGAAGAWRDCARRVRGLGDEVDARASTLSSTWRGPSREAFVAQTWPFLRQVDAAAADMERYAVSLEQLADGIDAAQREFHTRMIAVGATLAVGAALTVFTATLSDEAAAAAVAAEVATATELATTAATEALSALSWLTAQAAQLGLRVLVFTGVGVVGDAIGASLAYDDGRPWAHLHLREDVEWAAIGAVAMPLGTAMLGDLAERGVSLTGASGTAVKLGVGGLSMAQADVLVRSALGEHVDAEELAMAALPLGAAGRGGERPRSRAGPGGGLAGRDRAGGHTMALHVGKSDSEILDRFKLKPNLLENSTFYDLDIAARSIGAVLRLHHSDIEAWLAGTNARYRPGGRFDYYTGRHATNAERILRDVKGVLVVLQRDPGQPRGYRIVTAFPTP